MGILLSERAAASRAKRCRLRCGEPMMYKMIVSGRIPYNTKVIKPAMIYSSVIDIIRTT